MRRIQRGYLFEIPLILAVLFLALALILPRLPGLGRKILLAVATVPTLVCLFYLIVLPGWAPGTPLRGRPAAYRLALFLACAAATVAAVAVFILR